MNTVDKNKTFFTERQQVESKRAIELFNLVGGRSVEDLKSAIRMNLNRNNQVTNKAVQWATNINGPDIGQLKVHTTRRRPNPFVDTSIDIPDELLEVQKDVTIEIDGLKINGLKFFVQNILACLF